MGSREPPWDVTARSAIAYTGSLQVIIRGHGYVDVLQIMRNPMKRGALAELESMGAIEFTGPPTAEWTIPCRVVPAAERKAVRERKAIQETREWSTIPMPSRRGP